MLSLKDVGNLKVEYVHMDLSKAEKIKFVLWSGLMYTFEEGEDGLYVINMKDIEKQYHSNHENVLKD